ncbi:MAG: hypothetical protein M3O33_17530 [Cyanobacteriota bacterium]|nr:hypothetical protein [Cyanobacteriota bacterium]
MKHHLKIAINFLASLVVMVSGTMQAAQADEVWLDFSVPEADVVLASNTGASPSSQLQNEIVSSTKALTQKRMLMVSGNADKLIALDFGVPTTDVASAPVAPEISGETEPRDLKPKPATKKPSIKTPTTSAVKIPTSKPSKTRSKQVTALRRAIIGQESAGKFWIINPDSGALGYGQLLKENVKPWTKAALGRSVTVKEFLANPELQIQTIDHKLDEYLQRELAYTGGKNEEVAIRRVAATWYSGNPKLWNNPSPQFSNGRRYPSIESYTYSVWRRYQREIG